jgi:branched-subunit amino acid transport protein
MNIWVFFILTTLVTYMIRLSFIILIGRKPVPSWLNRMLRFIPPAVLTALIFPDVFLKEGALYLSPANPRILAGILAVFVIWRTRNSVLTILVGMLTMWLIQYLGGS